LAGFRFNVQGNGFGKPNYDRSTIPETACPETGTSIF
jgi:hypothetical protein